jgi:hypothetical protein
MRSLSKGGTTHGSTAVVQRPFDVEHLPEFFNDSSLWIVCEFEGNLPQTPHKPFVSTGNGRGPFWPAFVSESLAKWFIAKQGLAGYRPFELYNIWFFYNFIRNVSESRVTHVAIYTAKNKTQFYTAKDLLQRIEDSLD